MHADYCLLIISHARVVTRQNRPKSNKLTERARAWAGGQTIDNIYLRTGIGNGSRALTIPCTEALKHSTLSATCEISHCILLT